MIVVGERRHGGAEEGERVKKKRRKEGRPLMKEKTPKEIKERKTKEAEIKRREKESRVKEELWWSSVT